MDYGVRGHQVKLRFLIYPETTHISLDSGHLGITDQGSSLSSKMKLGRRYSSLVSLPYAGTEGSMDRTSEGQESVSIVSHCERRTRAMVLKPGRATCDNPWCTLEHLSCGASARPGKLARYHRTPRGYRIASPWTRSPAPTRVNGLQGRRNPTTT